jgi:metal-dependent amidase/aminoacylase/carboxypeptidase family protein
MDAGPSTAPDPAPFPSQVPGVRHICGHDVHVAIGLGLASALASVRGQIAGRVMFIFQPSEERATGARAMLADGLFRAETPVAIYGLHSAPIEVRDLTAVVGKEAFVELDAPPPGFSEDFGDFQKLVPGVFFFLGLSNTAKGVRAMPHDAAFNVDEAGISFGIRAMAAVVLGRLQ